MIIQCKECGLQISDKAVVCPHCGCPSENEPVRAPVRKYTRRPRLPNGFGQITKISGQRLNKPYRAMVTVGKNENGKFITKLLKPVSYFESYNEAYTALLEYNKNPYMLSQNITVEELHEKWFTEHRKKLKSESSIRNLITPWKYCSAVYKTNAIDMRPRHIRECVENGFRIDNKGKKTYAPVNIKKKISVMFNLMFDYAVEYELVEHNYARDYKLSIDIKKELDIVDNPHEAYTDNEINILWKNIDDLYSRILLLQCYTGLRPQEIGLIETDKVNINEGYFTAGMKTKAGTDRTIPIHLKILPIVKMFYDEAVKTDSKYLINVTRNTNNKTFLSYHFLLRNYNSLKEKLGLNSNHRLHDGRKYFITKAKEFEMDEYAIKYIVGHSINDITEKIYTERRVEWLKTEIEKIKITCENNVPQNVGVVYE